MDYVDNYRPSIVLSMLTWSVVILLLAKSFVENPEEIPKPLPMSAVEKENLLYSLKLHIDEQQKQDLKYYTQRSRN